MWSFTEATFMYALQSTVSAIPGGKTVAVFFARWLIVLFFVGLMGIYLRQKTTAWQKHWLKETGWSVLLAFVLALSLSEAIQRVRPFVAFPELVTAWIPFPSSQFAFPSAHAATVFAGAFAAKRALPSFAGGFLLIAFLVAFGRVCVGVHFPTDVLFGAFIGWLASACVGYLHTSARHRLPSSL
jgi:undecaprenyl-diphosphatase